MISLKNIFYFFKNKPPKFPDNYTVGEEYFKDKNQIEVQFSVAFPSFSPFSSITLDTEIGKLSLTNQNSHIFLRFEGKISEKLFNDSKHQKGINWIFGYVAPHIDYLNQEIYKQRYRKSNLLLQPYSILNISYIEISKISTKKKVKIQFPMTVGIQDIITPKIPVDMSFFEHIYVRDLIDALNSYFFSNFDDCVRRLITSVETSFQYYSFNEIKDKNTNSIFKGTLDANCSMICPMTKKNVAEEVWSLYKVRNEIVHEGRRIKPTEKRICDDGIHYVLDYFKNLKVNNGELSRFILQIEGEYMVYKDFVGQGLTLDILKDIK